MRRWVWALGSLLFCLAAHAGDEYYGTQEAFVRIIPPGSASPHLVHADFIWSGPDDTFRIVYRVRGKRYAGRFRFPNTHDARDMARLLEVGVQQPDGSVHNAMPMGMVADLTREAPLLRVLVRYTSPDLHGEEPVPTSWIVPPTPFEPPAPAAGLPPFVNATITVPVGRSIFTVKGVVFIDEMIWMDSKSGRGGGVYRGIYRLSEGNTPFTVDVSQIIEAVSFLRHRASVAVQGDHGIVQSTPKNIEISLEDPANPRVMLRVEEKEPPGAHRGGCAKTMLIGVG